MKVSFEASKRMILSQARRARRSVEQPTETRNVAEYMCTFATSAPKSYAALHASISRCLLSLARLVLKLLRNLYDLLLSCIRFKKSAKVVRISRAFWRCSPE